MESETRITKKFLEETLKTNVDRFVIKPGSKVGDNFTCLLYSVEVWTTGSDEPLSILVKCYPRNPARQQMLDDMGVFGVELGMYDTVIPALTKFTVEQGAPDIRLPFAPFLGGRQALNGNRNRDQLDDYLIMTDLRKKGGFQVRDKFKGLDLDHFKLVVEGQATLHAVSWAFHQIQGKRIEEIFPILTSHKEKAAEWFNQYMTSWPALFEEQKKLFENEHHIFDGLEYLQSVAIPATKLYFEFPLREDEKHFNKDNVVRKPGKVVENEEPWKVLLHGDCWSNNLLFRYDPVTKKPVEVVFIDLQACREGDIFFDLLYSTFVNTIPDVRRKHMTSLLHIYYDTFTSICERFSVPSLPGWSWEEFNRRYHRAQVFGVAFGAAGLPMVLRDDIEDLENVEVAEDAAGHEGTKKVIEAMTTIRLDHPVMQARLRGVLEDGVNAGVI